MGDQNDVGIPIGDASSLIDNLPPTTVERQTMPVPISERIVSPDGEVLRDPKPGDKPVGVMPGELVRVVTGQEHANDVKRLCEPCPSCTHFSWPAPGSDDYRWIQAALSSFVSTLPDWQKATVPGMNIAEWGSCEHPSGKRVCVHVANSCSEFRNKRN